MTWTLGILFKPIFFMMIMVFIVHPLVILFKKVFPNSKIKEVLLEEWD